MSKINQLAECYESGYSSDSSVEGSTPEKSICQFCRKPISGPRIGMVVHFATNHTEKSRQEISKITKASEMHIFVTVRKRTLSLLL